MITFEQIMTIFVAVAPSLTAIFGVIAAVCKAVNSNKATSKEVLDKVEEVRQEIYNTKEYTELKAQLLTVSQENLELKKKLNKLLTQIDKINRSKEE
jgi:hypothetical protein